VVAYRPNEGQFAAVFTNITDQKLMEKKLLQSSKMEAIGTLAEGIAHDFNNILFPIVGHAELLLKRNHIGSEEHTMISEILKASRRAKEMVKRVLQFRKTDQKGALYPIKIHEVMDEVLGLVKPAIPQNIIIKEMMDRELGLIMANSNEIHQALLNIITNSIRALPNGGNIEILIQNAHIDKSVVNHYPGLEVGDYVKVSICDNGIGMNKETLDRAFEPYFTTSNVGAGIGLFQVHKVMSDLQGQAYIYSEEGKGTTVNLLFWRMDNGFIGQLEDHAPIGHMNIYGKENILVVDDDSAITNLINTIFKEHGYNPTIFNSSVDALKHFQENPTKYSLVLTDMSMPKLSGYKLAEEIKNINHDVPIILCSGFGKEINGLDFDDKTIIQEVLMKPVGGTELCRAVRSLLDKK